MLGKPLRFGRGCVLGVSNDVKMNDARAAGERAQDLVRVLAFADGDDEREPAIRQTPSASDVDQMCGFVRIVRDVENHAGMRRKVLHASRQIASVRVRARRRRRSARSIVVELLQRENRGRRIALLKRAEDGKLDVIRSHRRVTAKR